MARVHLTHAQVPRAQLPTLFVDRKPRVTAPCAITCLTAVACVARMVSIMTTCVNSNVQRVLVEKPSEVNPYNSVVSPSLKLFSYCIKFDSEKNTCFCLCQKLDLPSNKRKRKQEFFAESNFTGMTLTTHNGASWTEGPHEKFKFYVLPMKNLFSLSGILLVISIPAK